MLQKFCLLLAPFCAAAMMATGAFADDLKVGDKAPDFKLIGTDGKTYTLADLKGKTIVLAWFPKAFTGG